MTTTTKKVLARHVAPDIDRARVRAEDMVEALFVGLREQLAQGHRIEVRGFGTLLVKRTAPKPMARNPKTGEIIFVPARRKTYFRPGQVLKAALSRPRSE